MIRAKHYGYAIALAIVVCGLLLASRAGAAVSVSAVPDHAVSTPREANGWTVTTSGPVDAIRFLLPSHGRPCGRADQAGRPKVGGDPDTNFLVTGSEPAGALVTGRWVTFPGPFPAGASVHVDVLTPPLGGCFYAGATADAGQVDGLAKGAAIFNAQGALATGGTVSTSSDEDPYVTITWWTRNDTPEAVELWSERAGAQAGFGLVSSEWLTSPKTARRGVSWSWRDQTIIDQGETLVRRVVLKRPCGNYSVNLRLRIETTAGVKVGIGNGLNVKLRKGC